MEKSVELAVFYLINLQNNLFTKLISLIFFSLFVFRLEPALIIFPRWASDLPHCGQNVYFYFCFCGKTLGDVRASFHPRPDGLLLLLNIASFARRRRHVGYPSICRRGRRWTRQGPGAARFGALMTAMMRKTGVYARPGRTRHAGRITMPSLIWCPHAGGRTITR